jgi:hypothetical protein
MFEAACVDNPITSEGVGDSLAGTGLGYTRAVGADMGSAPMTEVPS